FERSIVEAEIDDGVALVDDRGEAFVFINLAGDLQFGNFSGAIDERLAHAAFGTGDDDSGHNVLRVACCVNSISHCTFHEWFTSRRQPPSASRARFRDFLRPWARAANDIPLQSGPS